VLLEIQRSNCWKRENIITNAVGISEQGTVGPAAYLQSFRFLGVWVEENTPRNLGSGCLADFETEGGGGEERDCMEGSSQKKGSSICLGKS